MRLVQSFENKLLLEKACVFTFGTFDGVHLGHQYIFKAMLHEAKKRALPTACLTFSNHPSVVLSPTMPQGVLSCNEKKIALLGAFDFDLLIVLPFDATLQTLSAVEFLQKIRKMVSLSAIVVGSDVAFGKDRQGNQAFLKAQSDSFSCLFLERYCVDNAPVSSSRIRAAISQADFMLAEKLLGRPYSVIWQNRAQYCLPPAGVYVVEVQGSNASSWEKKQATISSVGQIDLIDYASCPVEFRFLEQK